MFPPQCERRTEQVGASDVCINLKGVTHTSSLGLKGMICGWGGVDVAVSIAADRPPCSLSLEEPAPTWCHPSDLIGHHKQQPPPPQHGKPIQEKKRWVVLKITVIYGAVTKYGAITKEEEMLEAPTTGRRRHKSRRHSPGRIIVNAVIFCKNAKTYVPSHAPEPSVSVTLLLRAYAFRRRRAHAQHGTM